MVFVEWRDSGKNPYFAKFQWIYLFHFGAGVEFGDGFGIFPLYLWKLGKSDLQPLGFHIQEFNFGYLARF